ncbi:MAG TPA: BON domain-containing protein [Salinisphaeraceae bacterium]|nr:BON domain-containing protein [Salinisphaeraceae bacterium]
MHKSKQTFLLLLLAVSVCVAGSAAALAAADSSAAADKGAGVGQAISDTWITTKVKAELAVTKGVESTNISVDTKDGVVTLTGVLAEDTEVKKAVAAAESIEGVQEVDHSGLKTK